MNIFVLYDKSGLYSGRVLGTRLYDKLREKAQVSRGRPEQLARLQRQGTKVDYVVNVGTFRPISAPGAVVLNNPDAIALSSNKRQARIKMRDAGVPAPQLWTAAGEVQATDLPVVGRTTHHTKGRGFWLCKTLREVKAAAAAGATHFLKFIPDTREFRVHVMAPANPPPTEPDDYCVIKLSEKTPAPGGATNKIVKSHDNGWVFSYPEDHGSKLFSQVRTIAKQALAAFGLHWGAVDIVVPGQGAGDPLVLEINSTPCLTDDQANTLQKYVEGILPLVQQAPPRARKRAAAPRTAPPAAAAAKKRVLKNLLSRYSF